MSPLVCPLPLPPLPLLPQAASKAGIKPASNHLDQLLLAFVLNQTTPNFYYFSINAKTPFARIRYSAYFFQSTCYNPFYFHCRIHPPSPFSTFHAQFPSDQDHYSFAGTQKIAHV
jgi:hypothetical protein